MTSNKYDLEEVLDAVVLAERKPSHEALVRWTIMNTWRIR